MTNLTGVLVAGFVLAYLVDFAFAGVHEGWRYMFGERASEFFPFNTPRRHWLFTHETQWQSRGKRRISQGFNEWETLGVGGSAILGVLQLFGMLSMPRSPRWLLLKVREGRSTVTSRIKCMSIHSGLPLCTTDSLQTHPCRYLGCVSPYVRDSIYHETADAAVNATANACAGPRRRGRGGRPEDSHLAAGGGERAPGTHATNPPSQLPSLSVIRATLRVHTGRRFQSESTLQDFEIAQILHDLDV